VKAIFSSQFKADLFKAETRYGEISPKLAAVLRERIAGEVREVIRRGGGDHIGPHGFPCRRTKPFPFYICYKVQGGTLFFLALVHERRHPAFLKGHPGSRGDT
jgi:hypothetical protein